MRTSKWMLTAALLASLSAAQQPADSQASAQPAAPDAMQAAQPSQQSISVPAQNAPAAQSSQPLQPAAQSAPTTMDQVVSLFVEREHGLIKMLATRTPVVETYLQNLSADPVLGPVPSEDHYFLGRMDMGETVDRKDY
jgi:hypothetical protein